jgi:hypothetical protein
VRRQGLRRKELFRTDAQRFLVVVPHLTLASQFDGEAGRGATSWAGTVKLRYGW